MSDHGHNEHGHNDGHADHAGDDHESHGGFSTYFSVFVALLVLTGVSFGVGSSSLMPLVKNSIMIAVSSAKALLVMLFFMHLKWEANWKYVLTIPASIMSLFLVLMLWPDVGARMKMYSEERSYFAAESHDHKADHGGSEHSDHGKKDHEEKDH